MIFLSKTLSSRTTHDQICQNGQVTQERLHQSQPFQETMIARICCWYGWNFYREETTKIPCFLIVEISPLSTCFMTNFRVSLSHWRGTTVSFESNLSLFFIYLFYLLLTQGEYIAPEKIENVYLRSPFAAQVFVCGNSLKVGSIPSPKTANFIDDVIWLFLSQSFVVAIVVPDAEVLEVWARSKGLKGDMKELCQNEVNRIWSKNKLLELKFVK